MKARVWTIEVKPGQVAEVQRAYAAHMAHTRGRKGFQHSFLLTNAAGDRAISVGIWDTEADMMASDVLDANDQTLNQAADMFHTPPSHEFYDVSM
jgi:heme-degrading monooxygenase HmoA